MTAALTLDPIRAADRHEAAIATAARQCRGDAEAQAAARADLVTTMLSALQGPATKRVPTPGNTQPSAPVFELFIDLDDAGLAELFGIVRDAAAGQDVRLRALLLQKLVAKAYGDTYADAAVLGAGMVL